MQQQKQKVLDVALLLIVLEESFVREEPAELTHMFPPFQLVRAMQIVAPIRFAGIESVLLQDQYAQQDLLDPLSDAKHTLTTQAPLR